MQSKLVLVEGLPSSGKSTTAEMVNQILTDFKIDNELFYEGKSDHPADYDGVAFFDEEQCEQLISSFPSEKDNILKISTINERGYFVDYKKGAKQKIEFPSELLHEFFENDVYELPLETHMGLIKNKWKEFANKAIKEDRIYIFDCSIIQNPVTVTMIRDNLNPELIFRYIKELESIILDLNPLLIYIDQKDIDYSFRRVIDKRPKEWLDFFTSYYTQQGYGRQMGYEGLDGVIQILRDRRELELELLKSLGIRTQIIDNSAFDLQKLKEELNTLLLKEVI